ncbi:MAG: hypothetical protein ACKO3M_10570 [Rubrivivax sp.]
MPTTPSARAQRLFWGWAVAAGLALFVAWWMQMRGLWQQLVDGDPSGISLGIVALAVATTLWCGRRCAQLQRAARARAPEVAAQLVAERCHGPHETAWWFASAAIKLGLQLMLMDRVADRLAADVLARSAGVAADEPRE